MKIYSVTFIEYTNAVHDTVSNTQESISGKYIHVGRQSFLVTEDQLIKIQKYGGGISSCIFVGNLWDEDHPFAIEMR